MSEQPTPTSKPQPARHRPRIQLPAERDLEANELRQQIISVTLTLAGVFLGFGLTTATVALVYPAIE